MGVYTRTCTFTQGIFIYKLSNKRHKKYSGLRKFIDDHIQSLSVKGKQQIERSVKGQWVPLPVSVLDQVKDFRYPASYEPI